MVPRDKGSLTHVVVKMGNEFYSVRLAFLLKARGRRRWVRMRACEGVLDRESVLAYVDDRVHDRWVSSQPMVLNRFPP